MDNLHPALVIEVARLAHHERVAGALASYRHAAPATRGPTPRRVLASALVALASRLAQGTPDRRADGTA